MKKRSLLTLIGCVCGICLCGHRTSAQEILSTERNRAAAYQTVEEQSWQDSPFYRTIIENNIFRPLGWTPPKPTPVYRLLGTVISTDSIGGQAILQEIASKRLHFLTVGTSVGDATVTEILSKQVTLDNTGQAVTLKMGRLQFLSPTHTWQQGKTAAQTSVSRAYESPTDQIKSVSSEKRKQLIQQYYRK